MTSHIRIPDVSPLVQSVADGSRRIFDFPFPVFRAADLEVRVGEAVIADGFAVRGAGSSDGGAIVFAAAPAAGLRVTIRRRQTYARTDDFLDERAPTPHELNDAVDQNVAALQELAEDASRAVRRSAAADLSRAVDLTLPEPEAAKVLGWNG
ncbi:phage tail fiber protein [Paramagnetospirillum magneticum]|nr:phage tail fiber protein [Paramagnetospirillum magneticum]